MQPDDEVTRKVQTLPVSCAKGHQVYVLFFPELKRYGFGCGMCHTLGTTVTCGNKVLGIRPVNRGPQPHMLKEELMLGLGAKGVHVCCGKRHYIMVMEFGGIGYGFGCVHCKTYALETSYQETVLEIRVLRELHHNDANVLRPHQIA
jgi:hypothetical protein